MVSMTGASEVKRLGGPHIRGTCDWEATCSARISVW